MLNKINKGFGKIGLMLAMACVFAQNVFAAAAVTLPTTAKSDLEDIVKDNFEVIIGVVILLVGVGLLVRLVRKAGGGG